MSGFLRDEVVPEDVGAGGERAEQVEVGEQRAEPAALQRLVPQDAAERVPTSICPCAQRLLGVDGRHDDQLDLLDLVLGQAVLR